MHQAIIIRTSASRDRVFFVAKMVKLSALVLCLVAVVSGLNVQPRVRLQPFECSVTPAQRSDRSLCSCALRSQALQIHTARPALSRCVEPAAHAAHARRT